MNNFLKFLFGSISFFCALVCASSSFAGNLQNCVGTYCIGKKTTNYQQLIKKTGPNKVKALSDFDNNRSLCIYDEKSDTSTTLTFSGDQNIFDSKLDGIFLSKGMLCEKKLETHMNFFPCTENGLCIDQSEKLVSERLGKPSRIDNAIHREALNPNYKNTRYDSIFGITRLHYEDGSDSLLFNQFGIDKKGNIVSIWLSEAP
ncbi:hypothetical protein [Undibacterium sp. RuTC16W]|uniref:hypothetical protein n=1 Tax=Undibacterium sp. RuTC16W TaxID=3413048 RepID=UPI003BEF9E5C